MYASISCLLRLFEEMQHCHNYRQSVLSSTLSLLSNSSANHYLVKISHLNHFLLQFGHGPVGKDAVVCVGHFDPCVCTTWFCITAIIIQVFSAEHLHTMVQWTPSGMTAPWSAYLYLLVLHHCCYYPGLLCSTPAHNGSLNTKWCDSTPISVCTPGSVSTNHSKTGVNTNAQSIFQWSIYLKNTPDHVKQQLMQIYTTKTYPTININL